MQPLSRRLSHVLGNPPGFLACVLRGFRANQGFLLAGAVAYYTLLSIVPMFALIVMVLARFIEPERLLAMERNLLALVAPGQTAALTGQQEAFLADWTLIGLIGVPVLLFFSSMAFTVLENAMSVIFFHRVQIRRRHFLVSAILPYFYILLLAVGLLVVGFINGVLDTLGEAPIVLMGYHWSLASHTATLMYLFGLVGEILLFSSVYLVMPVGRIPLLHALAGGFTATLLWEITRRLLVWYFSNLSFVNIIYGTLATAVIILLTLEAAAIILLLGAQVIAEYERIETGNSDRQGLET